MESIDNNSFAVNEDFEEHEFKYNFVNTPWDDRTKNSKIGIIALLLAIIIATTAGILNSFVMHYECFESDKLKASEFNCELVRMEDYAFAVRIHSVASEDMVCIGALVNERTVLVTGACVKSGPIRLRLGSLVNPRCKKGFSVDVEESISHDGVLMSKKMVVLYAYENTAQCANTVVEIGVGIKNDSHAFVIGRTKHGGRRFSRQPVEVVGSECSCSGIKTKDKKNSIICVKALARCPVLAGDLLIQDGRLFGLASTSVRRADDNRLACFASLKLIAKELRELNIPVEM